MPFGYCMKRPLTMTMSASHSSVTRGMRGSGTLSNRPSAAAARNTVCGPDLRTRIGWPHASGGGARLSRHAKLIAAMVCFCRERWIATYRFSTTATAKIAVRSRAAVSVMIRRTFIPFLTFGQPQRSVPVMADSSSGPPDSVRPDDEEERHEHDPRQAVHALLDV